MNQLSRSMLAAAGLMTGLVAAQGTSPLTLSLAQALVRTVTVGGKSTEQLNPAPKTVQPGDVLSQLITASNAAAKPLSHVMVRLPVPKGTVYLKPSGALNSGVTMEFSIDGGKTYAPAPLKKQVSVTENGKTVLRDVVVKPSEYTAVRWTLAELPANGSVQLGFLVQVK